MIINKCANCDIKISSIYNPASYFLLGKLLSLCESCQSTGNNCDICPYNGCGYSIGRIEYYNKFINNENLKYVIIKKNNINDYVIKYNAEYELKAIKSHFPQYKEYIEKFEILI